MSEPADDGGALHLCDRRRREQSVAGAANSVTARPASRQLQTDFLRCVDREIFARKAFDGRPVIPKKGCRLDRVRCSNCNTASVSCSPAGHLKIKSIFGCVLSEHRRPLHMAHFESPPFWRTNLHLRSGFSLGAIVAWMVRGSYLSATSHTPVDVAQPGSMDGLQLVVSLGIRLPGHTCQKPPVPMDCIFLLQGLSSNCGLGLQARYAKPPGTSSFRPRSRYGRAGAHGDGVTPSKPHKAQPSPTLCPSTNFPFQQYWCPQTAPL
jgi:hypothetical protein